MIQDWQMKHGRSYVDGLMQKRRNSIANALELCLFYIISSRPSDAYMHT